MVRVGGVNARIDVAERLAVAHEQDAHAAMMPDRPARAMRRSAAATGVYDSADAPARERPEPRRARRRTVTEVVDGRFAIEREAGAGGMARVYRARDTATGEIVALKVLNNIEDQDLRRFAREVHALAELHHPSIVRYIAHGRTT